MGMMDLSDFRTEIQSAMGNLGFDNPRLDIWINFGYLELCGAIEFEVLDDSMAVTLISGTSSYAGPVDPLVVKIVHDTTNDSLLRWIPKQEYYRLSQAGTGPPQRWTRDRGQIRIYPKPTAVGELEIVYQRLPEILKEETDKSVLNPGWDAAIFQLGVHHGLMAVGQENRAMAWFNRAVAYIQSRLTDGELIKFTPGVGLTLPQLTEAKVAGG